MSEMNFEGKTVVVTGSGMGLGLDMVRGFAAAGAHVVIAEINIELGRSSAEALRRDDLSVSYEPLDVRDSRQSKALVKKLVKDRGQIDVWVNNAGVAYKGSAETLTVEAWDQSIAVMLSGAFYCSQAAGVQMLGQEHGVIVNVSSVNGFHAIEGRVAYSTAKAGLIMLTQALGIEWAGRGVRVVGIAPGVVMTDLVRKGLDEGTASLGAYKKRTPMRRLGTVEEIAEAVIYLASDEASFVVGETLCVDGGWGAYQYF